jgi:hypothetical protein
MLLHTVCSAYHKEAQSTHEHRTNMQLHTAQSSSTHDPRNDLISQRRKEKVFSAPRQPVEICPSELVRAHPTLPGSFSPGWLAFGFLVQIKSNNTKAGAANIRKREPGGPVIVRSTLPAVAVAKTHF